MPLFDYKCPRGHVRTITQSTDAILCGSDCSEIARRRFSFSIARSIPEHFNHSTNSYVNNVRELKDTLKHQADTNSSATGIDHNYEYLSPADMSDISSRGVTTEGLNESALRKIDPLL